MVDASVLKHIYHAIHSSENQNQKLVEFCNIWRTFCMPKKVKSVEEMVDYFFDKVDGEQFENFINKQEGKLLLEFSRHQLFIQTTTRLAINYCKQ